MAKYDDFKFKLTIFTIISLFGVWFATGTLIFINGDIMIGLGSFLLPPLVLVTSFQAGAWLGLINLALYILLGFIFIYEIITEKRKPQRNPYYNSVI